MVEGFLHPRLLLVALPIAAVGGFLLWRLRRCQASVRVSSASLLQALPRTARERLRHAPLILRFIALASLLLALAGPEGVIREQREESRGTDIVLTIDVSQSMLAQDIKSDRLGAAKRTAQALVAGRPLDRFAVVTFAGDVQTNCPLTFDHSAITAALRAVDSRQRSEGTALGTAIAHAVGRVSRAAGNKRAIVLFTDGSENVGAIDSASAAALARAHGVRVYAIGIGSTRPAPFPTEFGPVSVVLDLDENALEQVARTSGGRYLRVTDDRTLERMSEDFDRFEPAKSIMRNELRLVDFSYVYALLALICVSAEKLLASGFCRTFS